MFRIIVGTLLLLALVDSIKSASRPKASTREHPHAALREFTSVGFSVKDIRKCRCKTVPDSSTRLWCPLPLVSTNDKVEELKKCLCQQTNKRCHPRIRKYCNSTCFLPAASPL